MSQHLPSASSPSLSLKFIPMTKESSQAQSDIHFIWHEISVLKRIIESIADDSTASPSHLLSIALTCKLFRDPALDLLWRSLDSWMPLLKLLTPFKLVNGFYVLQGPFGDKDWERFDTYAHRVKRFHIPHQLHVARSTYFQLAQLRPHLLPALEEATSLSTAEQNTPLLLALSPTIKRLNLGGTQAAFDLLIGPALSMIAYGSGEGNLNLTHLTLCGQPSIHAPGLLCQFLNLRHLDISGVIDAQNFCEIGELGHLESMVVRLPDSLIFPNNELRFGQLRSLHVTSSFSSLLTVLEKMATTTLERITIVAVPTPEHSPKPTPEPSPELAPPLKKAPTSTPASRSYGLTNKKVKKLGSDVTSEAAPPPVSVPLKIFKDCWRECFGIINSRWSETIQSITIDQDESIHTFTYHTPWNLFSGLSAFKRLECLKVQRCKFFPFDEGIHLLALACPNITALHLPVECVTRGTSPSAPKADLDVVGPESSRSTTSTTIVALWSLCDSCPKLEDLQISLDIINIPQFLNTAIRSHHLAQLSVGSHPDTTIDQLHILNIARHIDRLFPYLEIVSHPSYGAHIWDQIGSVLSVYKMVRWDDRERRPAPGILVQPLFAVDPAGNC